MHNHVSAAVQSWVRQWWYRHSDGCRSVAAAAFAYVTAGCTVAGNSCSTPAAVAGASAAVAGAGAGRAGVADVAMKLLLQMKHCCRSVNASRIFLVQQ